MFILIFGRSFRASRLIPANLDGPAVALQVGSEWTAAEEPAAHVVAQPASPGQGLARVLPQGMLIALDGAGADVGFLAERQRPDVDRPALGPVPTQQARRITIQQHIEG